MQNFLIFSIKNYPLTLLIIAGVCAVFSSLLNKQYFNKLQVYETILAYFMLFNIGIANLYNFVMHVFFGDFTAKFIGWEQSPFQLEVGFASLGFAIAGLISFKSKMGFRAATIIANSVFLLGAAIGHIYQMKVFNNFAPGNAGGIFWADIYIPIISFTLLYLQYKEEKRVYI